jgi:hypothetical protein
VGHGTRNSPVLQLDGTSGAVGLSLTGTAAGEAELSGAASTVEEREKLVAVPVAGTRNSPVLQLDGTSGAPGLSLTGTAAGEAEVSGASLTVDEREKLVAVPVAGTRNSPVLQLDGTSGASGLSLTGTAAGEAEVSGASLTVDEREKLIAVPVAGTRINPAAMMSHDRCTRPNFHPVSLQAVRCSWHETRTDCTWKSSQGTRLHRLLFSKCLSSFSPSGGRFLWCGAKIQVASSTVLASSQCCCRLVHATRVAASTTGQATTSTTGQAAAERRAAAVACIGISGSSVRLAPNGRIKVQSRFHQHPDPAAAASC